MVADFEVGDARTKRGSPTSAVVHRIQQPRCVLLLWNDKEEDDPFDIDVCLPSD